MNPYLSLIIGLVLAGAGGELFVRGAVGLAKWARIPAGIIGATVAAFATSSPEMAVSISAAAQGTPQIALGDALGSNVVNVGLILGLALLFGPITSNRQSVARDLPIAVLAPALTLLLCIDKQISRIDGAILLAFFLVWLVSTIAEARRLRDETAEVLGEENKYSAMGYSVFGLAALILAGVLIVDGAKMVGQALGMAPFVVGATIVSIGTSMPELATTIISRIRKHDEIGLGTVLGSNVFNGLFIVSIAALIHPIDVTLKNSGVGLGFGILTIVSAIPRKSGIIERRRGWLLLILYAAYIGLFLQQKPS